MHPGSTVGYLWLRPFGSGFAVRVAASIWVAFIFLKHRVNCSVGYGGMAHKGQREPSAPIAYDRPGVSPEKPEKAFMAILFVSSAPAGYSLVTSNPGPLHLSKFAHEAIKVAKTVDLSTY